MKFENSNDAKQKKHTIFEQMEALLEKRKNEKRGFTTDEATQYDNLKVEFDHLCRQILELERSEFEAIRNLGGKPMDDNAFNAVRGGHDIVKGNEPEFYDHRTEKPVKVYQRGERFADHLDNPDNLSVGRAIRGMISGDWSGAENEKRSLATSSNGGLLVPLSVFANVIDLARAKSVAAQSGARFVPMPDGNMSLVRVASATGFESKVENEAFSGGAVSFAPVNLKAFTLGTTVALSRELAADALNVAQMVETTLANGIADYLDKMIFAGSGDGEPLGLLNDETIGEVQTSGAVSYAHILRAWSLAKGQNADDLSIVSNPDLRAQFANLYEANSGFVTPPELLAALQWYASSNMPSNLGLGEDQTAMIVGDFRQLLIGIRQNAMIEVSHQAGDLFDKHQVGIKITLRADFCPLYPGHFTKITGIEPPADWWETAGYPVVGGDADDAADDS
jgi:HK97 family phage major capsid protein